MSGTAPSDPDAVLGSTVFARLQPAVYLSRFLDVSIRPDGRSFDDVRETKLAKETVGVADGSSVVRRGNTMIVAGIRAELLDISDEDVSGDEQMGEPDFRSRSQGIGPVDRRRVVVNIDMGPMAGPQFKSGPPGEEAQILASRLQRVLEVCPPLECTDLFIEKTSLSWCLFVDLVCVSYDGNIFDTSLLAINAALHDAKLPLMIYDESSSQVVQHESKKESLRIQACPISCTFSIVDQKYLLSDANSFEATLASGAISITLDMWNKQNADVRIVDLRCTGRCSATITKQEASQAGVDPSDWFEDESSDRVFVQDDALIRVCIRRAQQQCSIIHRLLPKQQASLKVD